MPHRATTRHDEKLLKDSRERASGESIRRIEKEERAMRSDGLHILFSWLSQGTFPSGNDITNLGVSMSEEADIQWGTIQVSATKANIFYYSFFSEGVEYKLYDNVQVYNGPREPYIGKIIKLWEEKQSGMKKVLIRWFLRLRDLDSQMEGDPKELYLAFGKGIGVTNENDLEVICGKSKVLCTSKDVRNKQPSASDLKKADFFFSKIYNVDLQHLSPVQKVVDKLGCEAVYNKEEWVTETLKSNDEQIVQSKSLQVSNHETLSKQEPESTHYLKPMLKDVGRDKEQKPSRGSALKRKQVLNAEEVGNKKLKASASIVLSMAGALSMESRTQEKLKASASIVLSMAGALSMESRTQENATRSNEVIVNKNFKVDGQQVLSKAHLPACTPPQTEANMKKSCQLADTIKVDEQAAQSKLDFPPCDSLLITTKSVNVEKSSSFKTISAGEITSLEVDDALERPVSNSQISRQPAEIKGLSEDDQIAKEAIPTSSPVHDGLGRAVTGSSNPRQLVETDSLPKVDRSAVNLTSLDSSNSKAIISEVQRDPPKMADNSSGFVEAEKSLVKRSISNLKANREAEVSAKVTASMINSTLEEKNVQEKVNFSPLPESGNFVKDSDSKEVNLSVNSGSHIEMKSVPTNELVKEKRRIFKELPWEENLLQGLSFGKVLLLQNLDPSLTSADVREMLKHILQGVSDVRVIPQETICPYGQALAIFDSRLLADNALQEMEIKCLVLASNKRPVIATKFKEISNLMRFPGHLALDKLRLSRNLGADDYKKAVSTSHSSQPNTIEYEMAMEWRWLQEITETCQAELFEKQKKEIDEIRKSCNRKGF
ncbi:hypothetical protein GOP47_0022065 [Adiantum capillus-veneris]|uniref:BAH domain-containing protein n=1 Tax=Adiantum capillus-veneris TaxID=13818 RepID=A0A9D4Z5T5_ADICA|nr:hypothetical protein GOP47_0022065 [Adiantum capillus-veneris]